MKKEVILYCSHCGTKMVGLSKFCPACGKSNEDAGKDLEYTCSDCGKDIPKGASYCWHCGGKIEKTDDDIRGANFLSVGSTPPSRPLKANKKIAEDSICKLCNAKFAIGEDIKQCEKCQNYFHDRCWTEKGGCNQAGCKEETKTCPMCGKEIKKSALKCKHCGQYLDETIRARQIPKGRVKEASKSLIYAIIGIFLFGLIFGWLAISNGRKALRIIENDPGYTGKGMAIAGIIIGIFDIVGWIVGIISYISGIE